MSVGVSVTKAMAVVLTKMDTQAQSAVTDPESVFVKGSLLHAGFIIAATDVSLWCPHFKQGECVPFFSLAWALLLVSQPSGALKIPCFRLFSAGKKCNLFSSVLNCLYLFFFFLFFSSLRSQVCNLRIKARICTGFRAVLHSSSPGSPL